MREDLARQIHEVYQDCVRAQGDLRYSDNYDDLAEHIKDRDRAIADFILANYQKKEGNGHEYDQD